MEMIKSVDNFWMQVTRQVPEKGLKKQQEHIVIYL